MWYLLEYACKLKKGFYGDWNSSSASVNKKFLHRSFAPHRNLVIWWILARGIIRFSIKRIIFFEVSYVKSNQLYFIQLCIIDSVTSDEKKNQLPSISREKKRKIKITIYNFFFLFLKTVVNCFRRAFSSLS